MAAANMKLLDDLMLEVTCSICRDIYTNPVTLICGHSFCQDCITKTFDNQEKKEYFCPECMKGFRVRPELNKNPKLSNIADFFRSVEPKTDITENVSSYSRVLGTGKDVYVKDAQTLLLSTSQIGASGQVEPTIPWKSDITLNEHLQHMRPPQMLKNPKFEKREQVLEREISVLEELKHRTDLQRKNKEKERDEQISELETLKQIAYIDYETKKSSLDRKISELKEHKHKADGEYEKMKTALDIQISALEEELKHREDLKIEKRRKTLEKLRLSNVE